MKPGIRSFTLRLVMLCLFGMIVLSLTAAAAESQEKEAPAKKDKEKAGHEPAANNDVPKSKTNQAKKAFERNLELDRERSEWEKRQKASASGKVDIKNDSKATGKTQLPASDKLPPPKPPTIEEWLQMRQIVDEEAAGKSKGVHEHSNEEGHHAHSQHQPADPCAKAGSPDKVANCKEARQKAREVLGPSK